MNLNNYADVLISALKNARTGKFKKGDNIFVRGKLRKRIFTDQDGQSRLAVEIIGSEIQIIKSAAEKAQNPIDTPDAPTDDNPLMTN